MAKKQKFTTSSKDKMRSRLQLQTMDAFSQFTGTDIANIPEYNFDKALTEPLMTELPLQDNTTTPVDIDEPVNINEPVDTIKESDSQQKEDANANYGFDDFLNQYSTNVMNLPFFARLKSLADPVFSFISGIESDYVERNSGKLLMNNKEKDDLQFQKEFLELEKELKLVDAQLNNAYLNRDTTKVRELYPLKLALLDAYNNMYDSYQATAIKYYNKYGHLKSADARIQALNEGIKEKELIAKEISEDIQWGRDLINSTNSIYSVSDKWKELELENWMYQVPKALGTSGSSLQATAINYAAIKAANYLAASAPATGVYAPFVYGGAVILGVGGTIATSLWSRDRESLSEVANNYKQNIINQASKNGIDIKDIAKVGRLELRRITGRPYSEDPNSEDYRSDDAVFEDMLAYDVNIGNETLDTLRASTKKNLKDIYNRNMVLSVGDVAQAATIIPGAGKVFTKVLGKLNLPERAVDKTVKILDKAIDYTTKKVAPKMSKVAKNKLSKYIVEPTVRIGANSLMEGTEEVTQFIIGNRINDTDTKETSLTNPLDIASMFLDNNSMALKGLAALVGVSGDPALDNNKELVDNFKVGAAIGLLMGGGSQMFSTVNDIRSYDAGTELARNMMAENIAAKDDMTKYIAYAKKANAKMLNREAFLDGINQQIESGAIPDGWTKEDLEAEKLNINSIFDIINNNPIINKFKGEDKAIAAAILKHKYDLLSNATKDYNTQVAQWLNNSNTILADLDSVISTLGIDAENRELVKAYLVQSNRLQALQDYIKVIQALGKTPKSDVDEFIIEEGETSKNVKELKLFITNAGIDLTKLDSAVISSRNEIRFNAINPVLSKIALDRVKDDFNHTVNTEDDLRKAVEKYKSTIIDAVEEEIEEGDSLDPIITPADLDEEVTPDVAVADGTTEDTSTDESEEDTEETTDEDDKDKVTPTTSILPKKPISPDGSSDAAEEDYTDTTKDDDEVYDAEDDTEDDGDTSFWDMVTNSNETEEMYEDLRGEGLTEDDFADTEDTTTEDRTDKINTDTEVETDEATSTDKAETDVADQIDKIDAPDANPDITPVIPDTHEITSNPEDKSSAITDEDVSNTKKYEHNADESQPAEVDDVEGELVYGTLYYLTDSDQPMFAGYESGRALNEFLSTPGALARAKVTAKIGPKNSKFGSYDPANKATWDEAPIYIEIEADGKKYIATLKTIEGARSLYLKRGMELSSTEEERIRSLRNQIIEAKLNDPDCEITFRNITISNGKFNVNKTEDGRVINRSLTDIEGLHIDDLDNLINGYVQFGIGKGIKDSFIIMDKDGMPLPGHGGSGRIFIYPNPKDTPSGHTVNIQLNEARFDETNPGLVTPLSRYLAKVLLYRDTENPGIYPEDVIMLVVNYGKSTIITPEDPRYEFLADKQFFIDQKNGYAQLGKEQVPLSELRTDAGVERLAMFIATNLHWNTEKNLLWDYLPNSFRETMIDDNLDKLELADGSLVFDLQDVGLKRVDGKLVTDEDHPKGLTTIQYLVKHGKLKSNLKDQLFTKPFVYVDSPVISSKPTEEQKLLLTEAESPTDAIPFILADLASSFDAAEEGMTTETETNDAFTNADSDEVAEFFGFDGAPKVMNKNQVKQSKAINTKRAKKWLQRTLGLTDELVEITNGVIRLFANGSAVYGIARADSIAISNKAVEGVQYHEAWHRVSLLMLDKETRAKLYSEFRKQYPSYSKLSNKQLEEVIADMFMDYMLNDKESKLRYYVHKVFRNIKKFLHINTKINPSNLNSIFDMIKYGDFKNYKLDPESYKEFLDSYTDGAYYKVGPNKDVTLKHFPTLLDFHSALDSLKACLFIANGAKYISDVLNLSNAKLKQFLQSFIKSNRTSTQQKEALQEIVDNFDVFLYHMRPMIEQMGIRSIDKKADEDFAERESTGILNYDKAGYEFDKKSNALASAKMFIATLSDTYFDYKDVNGVKARTLNTRINTITGLPMVVDYDTAYALILKNLSTVETFNTVPGADPETSLLGRCARLAKGNAFFAFLYKRLNGDIDINLQTQLLQTIKSFDQNFVEVHYQKDADGNTSFAVDDSINKRSTKMYPSTWSDLFFNSEMVIKTDILTAPNSPLITVVINRFLNLQKKVEENKNTISNTDVDLYIKELVSILNAIGIDIDADTIEAMLPDNRPAGISKMILSNTSGSLKYLFTDTLTNLSTDKNKYERKGVTTVRQLDLVYMGLGKNNFINQLAQAQALSHPSDTEITVLGPNNNIIYTKTLNCFVSDLIRWLNNHDDAVLTDLNADTYCRSSLILSAVNNNSKLKLNTFANFYGEDRGDKGRDYLSISPVEDYLAKMTFTYNNHIIFPTMADKKTWFTISGVGLFNRELIITQNGNSLKVQFDRGALKYLYRAWEDEYNTIVEYYNSLADVKVPIKNYHTNGKGGKFRHFTGYYAKVDGELKWIDLNARIQAALDDGSINQTLQEIKQELFTTPSDTFLKINDNLHMLLKLELDTCVKLGIIERDSTNPKILKNKLLDGVIFNKFKEIYASSANQNISKQAERYAILTMIGNNMINTNISVIETEKIFTGDVAFFKNDDDKIKRLGAVLSTGDNLRTEWSSSNSKDQIEHNRLQARLTYTNTTINDNNIPSRQHKQLEDLFTFANIRKLLIEKEGFTEAGVDELMKDQAAAKEKYPLIFELAESIAKEDASAYGMNEKGTSGNINQADAAVYIRPQMYRDIVKMLGEWSDEIEEAFNVMESGEDWLSNPELYQKSLKTLIKPLKTTYFGYTYDANLKHCIPVFNKMAMFPMFKVLATGDNREIYNRMNALDKYKGLTPIDQVAFESAVKVGIQGATDVYTDYTNTEINDLSNMHITTQKFRNLRRLLITDPHTHDRTLFGTLVSTVAVSNLVLDRVYQEDTDKETTGEQIKQDLFGTINAISNKGYREVLNMFVDSSDNTIDYEKASKQLINEARASNMGKDMEEALSVNEDKTDFKVPLAALPDSKWVETKLTSIVNKKAIDLELPGGAFIQMSSFGFKSIKAVGSKAINNGNPLLNINEDGSMDAIISINLFSHIIPDYKNKSFEEAKQWLIDHHIIGDGARPMAMGYRIPTQGLSSIAALRIVDVLPSVVGDTIILPDEFTAQTGSDFDITIRCRNKNA